MSGIRVRSSRRAGPFRFSLVLFLALVAAHAAAAARIVAVGDARADLPAFEASLQQAGLVDAGGAWAGGTTVFVQTGDLIDRGPSMRSVFDFVMALEQSAAAAGGRVVPLLGNHEV